MKDMTDNIIHRIIPILQTNTKCETRSDIWNWCSGYSSKVEINKENLENRANTNLVFGFFGGTSLEINRMAIIKLAQALGVMGLNNPEGGVEGGICRVNINYVKLTDSALLQKIEEAIGFKIQLPSFIGGRKTSATDYGIITDRHCHYLWILKRIIELFPDRKSSIVEIGAGLGILGYYLDKAGYKDYTTIDLAHTNACQTYFLARNLPDRDLILSGEKGNPFDFAYKDSLKVLHSLDFENIKKNRFDIMINIDGLTEMKLEEATKYMQSDCASVILSINHEVNSYRVIDIHKPNRMLKYRYPFWLRDGYVEELYCMSK